jgi:hypothetical protein
VKELAIWLTDELAKNEAFEKRRVARREKKPPANEAERLEDEGLRAYNEGFRDALKAVAKKLRGELQGAVDALPSD